MSGILAMYFAGRMGVLTLDISNKVNPDVVSLLTAAGWSGLSHPVVLVNNGLINTLDIPASMNGADITLINAVGCWIGGVRNGGTALKTRAAIKVQNLGTFAGGGGRGGQGGSAWVQRTLSGGTNQYASGSPGAVGDGQGFQPGALTILPATAGAQGTKGVLTATGSWGGSGGGRDRAEAIGGYSGNGGGWGQSGGYGNRGQALGDYDTGAGYADTPPEPVGFYVDGNGFVTWLATGARYGRVQ